MGLSYLTCSKIITSAPNVFVTNKSTVYIFLYLSKLKSPAIDRSVLLPLYLPQISHSFCSVTIWWLMVNTVRVVILQRSKLNDDTSRLILYRTGARSVIDSTPPITASYYLCL